MTVRVITCSRKSLLNDHLGVKVRRAAVARHTGRGSRALSAVKECTIDRATVACNGERSAGKAAEGFGYRAEIVLLIGWQPPECNQRVDRVALDFEHEADFALRAWRRGYAHLDRPFDELDQRKGEGPCRSNRGPAASPARSDRQSLSPRLQGPR